MSDSLEPLGLQQARLLCLVLSPRVCSDSCPLIWWCYLTISSSATHFFYLQFSQLWSLFHIRWPEYWSFYFSISPSNQYSGLISFRIDWVWPSCCPRDCQESSPAPQFKNINSSVLSLLYDPALTSIHDYWKYHIYDCMDLCWQSDDSAF